MTYEELQNEINMKLLMDERITRSSYLMIVVDDIDLIKFLLKKKEIGLDSLFDADFDDVNSAERNYFRYGFNVAGFWFPSTGIKSCWFLYPCSDIKVLQDELIEFKINAENMGN